ncbi:sugar phosphate nucleotidyltransferase [Enterococcus cecorum]|uniref:nucleotidyltransferase family protein n=1 Tax=Enterococcus cecorum TaxID=44008 RepID=UPI002ACA66CF|nr:sugar phosphate nucleotidyltransferase [Enterococcus cecorum]MDZ5439022.1 sugar phosphate nucleotidyltransferase [Enterococcus cecorum]MDZ5497083.1 sugar phosphate nucleotidyltransferase [Enterococcus cecorum]MDZ5499422.1 sugar phosphate nucleotidyltransferase [Enterococcus cecorum]MDZ5562391.1 sugar phosphate nucleotidyltransferase [Enterococcus cecorum]
MDTTLVIMAAGIGSRFGGGIKQLETVDENKHIIMDYSIHDAIKAGFNKIVFIIRKDIAKEFKEVIGDRIEKVCALHNVKVAYAYQELENIPGSLPEGRKKPWGTGQAVLAAKEYLTEPFVVINADDYYGQEIYQKLHDYLVQENPTYCMAGFILKNTLSDNGGVTRGICHMKDGYLSDIVETKNIVKTADGAESNGRALDVESLVSMNMWGLTPDFIPVLEKGFEEFFEKEVPQDPTGSEYLLPILVGELLAKDEIQVKVIKSEDTWYGMTYREDVEPVKASFAQLIAEGVYHPDLYDNLNQ